MLTHLYIKNYAIIDEIEISFDKGLTILTGETGAGKSIIMGALSKILGERADSQSIRNPDEKCIIEGSFDIRFNQTVQTFLTDNDIDASDELLIRREFSANGKSRIFVNDTPVTLLLIQSITALLIDLHRQFDTIELMQASNQLAIIDVVSHAQESLQQYQEAYHLWKSTAAALEKLQADNLSFKQELDYNQFLLSELEELKLQENEIELLESTLHVLEQSDFIKQQLDKSAFVLSEADDNVLGQLKFILQNIESAGKDVPAIQLIADRIQSILIELKDIASEITHISHTTTPDEEKISLISDRLNEANRLLKKHHVNSTAELIDIQSALAAKVLQATHADDKEIELTLALNKQFEKVKERAEVLSSLRQSVLPQTEKQLHDLLVKVGMPNAQIQIQHQHSPYHVLGADKIEFTLDANKTQKFQAIHKAASGGELSRIMLCLKSIMAGTTQMPTLIFDEIDTGISGETAKQVGLIMQTLALQHQIICITHLPQIAAKANQHLFIFKQESNAGIQTRIKNLSLQERELALAEMLSGKDISEQTLAMARELMK